MAAMNGSPMNGSPLNGFSINGTAARVSGMPMRADGSYAFSLSATSDDYRDPALQPGVPVPTAANTSASAEVTAIIGRTT